MNSLNFDTVFVHGLTRFFVHRLICGQSSDNCDATLASCATRHPRHVRRDARVLCDATPASCATRHPRPVRRDAHVLCVACHDHLH
jgi:hypothetical protein